MASEDDSSLATQCMAFCQALANQGKVFQFSLTIGPAFSFTLDTRCKDNLATIAKKRVSPSTLRRNAKRREEFLKKKLKPATVQEKIVTDKESTIRSATFQCDQCDNTFKTESGLRIHIGKSHKLPPTEKVRNASEAASLSASPLKDSARNISCHNCDEEMSPSHMCDEERLREGAQAGRGMCTCDCELPICCNCLHEQECKCCDENPDSGVCNCEGFVFHH